MSSRRARIVATTTVLGLGGLAGVALESNHGVPTPQLAQAGNGGSAAVVTTASGATVPASQATSGEATTRPPIVTRASGGGGGAGADVALDD
jgi:hypothetical protein